MEYEDLPLICFHCGKYSHTSELCKEKEHAHSMSMEGTMGWRSREGTNWRLSMAV